MASPIEMIGVIKPKADKVEQVEKLFSDIAAQVHAHEQGCLAYEVYTQTQAKGTPNVIFHEKYMNQQALDHHLQTEYFLKFAGALSEDGLLEEKLQFEEVFVRKIAGD